MEQLEHKLEYKTFKAARIETGAQGLITALVSTYDVDRQNEKVMPGAFKASLARKMPKLCWAHDWKLPIGKTLEAKETAEGLVVKGQFNLETQRGREAFSDLKFGSIDELSFGFRVVKDSYAGDSKDIRQLDEIEIFEWSPVLVGSQPATRVIELKQAAISEVSNMSANIEHKEVSEDLKPLRPPFNGKGGQPSGSPGYQWEAEPKGIARRIFEAKEIQDYLRSNATGEDSLSVTLPDVSFKTLLTTTTGWPVENVRSNVMVPYPTVQPRVSDVIPMIQTTQNAWVYMSETTFSDNAGTVLEGAEKPEATLALTEMTAQIRKVAVWIGATEEQLSDQESMIEYIDSRLKYMVQRKVDQQIVNGDGVAPNLLGILSVPGTGTSAKGSDPTPDAIFKAMTMVRDAGGEPSAVLLNPADWQEIQLLRTTEGIYLAGSPWDSGPSRIWGTTVIVSSSVPSGTGIVGDFANFTRLVVRLGLTGRVGYQGTDFTRNLKTFLAETRLAFVVLRPSCLVKVTGI